MNIYMKNRGKSHFIGYIEWILSSFHSWQDLENGQHFSTIAEKRKERKRVDVVRLGGSCAQLCQMCYSNVYYNSSCL